MESSNVLPEAEVMELIREHGFNPNTSSYRYNIGLDPIGIVYTYHGKTLQLDTGKHLFLYSCNDSYYYVHQDHIIFQRHEQYIIHHLAKKVEKDGSIGIVFLDEDCDDDTVFAMLPVAGNTREIIVPERN